MRFKTSTTLWVATLLVGGVASADATPAEHAYVQRAQAINQSELALGQLARERGTSDQVKQMARTMVERQSALSARLADLARERAIATSSGPAAEDQGVHDRLGRLSGRPFDEAFEQAVADAHARELALHRDELQHGGDAGLRSYAESRVKALEASMAQAKDDW